MTRLKTTTLITLTLLAASPAFANPNKLKHGNGHGNGNAGHVRVHIPAGCDLPPGIEKQIREGKRTSLPPGIAKNCAERKGFAKGDRLPDGYTILRDYGRYGLPDPGRDRYAISGDTIYKIARDAAIVITAMGIYNNIVNN
ncbi:hypothetical protein [Celeribacter naphthalenivorans]|uniref:hypothetical protein n=1 Tax=Celeribacter naphthalenivorans TaxID=1614694 RepID=UPI001CFADF78|nr:hypothetical protein [Celeribacter naphthalenivorans]